jgi:uncharacterized protein YbjT (DUF2867 family)
MAGLTVLVVGATGSIGRHVVAEALAAGHRVRALVRDVHKAGELPADAEIVVGDVTRPETLATAVEGIDAVVLTLGSDGLSKVGARTVDYEGVRNVLTAIGNRPLRIALMTSIGVTDRTGNYNLTTEAHDWKRRSERLVRASGHQYTIVRPGWFDYNTPDQVAIVMLQGDARHTGTPKDGVIARCQIAQVLVASLTSEAAERKTLELVAEVGPRTQDLEPLFRALKPDQRGSIDGVDDADTQPVMDEPASVQADLSAVLG